MVYTVLHAQDMVAFSCCIFDGGKQEKQDMIAARERGWKGKFTKPGRIIRPGAIRINGKCPLTPLEVGLMLRGMGFTKNTSIFLASGIIYNAEKTMAPLLQMFPNLHTKETLASEEELSTFRNYSSRMAAIDYTVCLRSEVFVTTQGGNFPHFLLGHRRYLYGGHSKTIKPDKRKLALLFDNPNIGWRSFKRQLLNMRSHSDSKGVELKRPNDSIYSFPCPECMCRANRTDDSKSSSAAWSTHGIWLVFLLPMILWACLATECISDTVIVLFSPLPIRWEGIPTIFEDQRNWIKYQGSGMFCCTWCQFRTEWKMFLCRNLSQNIEWAMFCTWVSSCCIERAI